jgi:hypothetical protein
MRGSLIALYDDRFRDYSRASAVSLDCNENQECDEARTARIARTIAASATVVTASARGLATMKLRQLR